MKKTTRMKIVALVFPGLTIAVLLLFALGETIGGDRSGLRHLLQPIPIGFLMWLGWKRPLWGGTLFLVLSLLVLYPFADALRGSDWPARFIIIIAPLLLSGVLLLGAAGLERRAA